MASTSSKLHAVIHATIREICVETRCCILVIPFKVSPGCLALTLFHPARSLGNGDRADNSAYITVLVFFQSSSKNRCCCGRLTFFQPKQKSSFVSYVSDSEDDVL